MLSNLPNIVIGILISAILIPIFLPKKNLYLIRLSFIYIVKICFKKIYLIIFLNIFLVVINFFCNVNFLLLNAFLIIFIIIQSVYSILNYKSKSFFMMMPSFVVNTDELKMDRHTREVNYILKNYIRENIHNYWLFRQSPKFINFVDLPEFLPLFFSEESYFSYIKKISEKNENMAIVFYKGEFLNQFVFELFVKKGIMRNFNELGLKNIYTTVSNLKISEAEKIELNLSFIFFILSQSFLDTIIDNENYEVAHEILGEMEAFINKIENLEKFRDFDEVKVFVKSWRTIVFRYYAFINYESKNYKISAKYLFKAQKTSSIFPRETYEDAKNYYINDYLKTYYETQLNSEETGEAEKLLITDKIEKFSKKNNDENYYTNIGLLEALLETADSDVIDFIDKEFDILFESDEIFDLLFVAEAYKYFPSSGDKFNKVYIENIKKTIFLIEKVLEKDSSFDFLYIRLMGLYLMSPDLNELLAEKDGKLKEVFEKAKPISHKYGIMNIGK